MTHSVGDFLLHRRIEVLEDYQIFLRLLGDLLVLGLYFSFLANFSAENGFHDLVKIVAVELSFKFCNSHVKVEVVVHREDNWAAILVIVVVEQVHRGDCLFFYFLTLEVSAF